MCFDYAFLLSIHIKDKNRKSDRDMKKEKQIVDSIMKKIRKRLPKTYFIPNIKIYKTLRGLLLSEARRLNISYKALFKWYEKHSKGGKYIKGQYEFEMIYKTPLSIQALAGNPIKLCAENIDFKQKKVLCFLLLHEIGHHYYKIKEGRKGYYDERKADLFAMRWIKKIKI